MENMNKNSTLVVGMGVVIIFLLAIVFTMATKSGGTSAPVTAVGTIESSLVLENYIPLIRQAGLTQTKLPLWVEASTTLEGLVNVEGAFNLGGELTANATTTIQNSNTATTTLNLKTNSTTHGFCIEAHATSSDTIVRITATTTSDTGVVYGGSGILIEYGGCAD